LTDTKTNP